MEMGSSIGSFLCAIDTLGLNCVDYRSIYAIKSTKCRCWAASTSIGSQSFGIRDPPLLFPCNAILHVVYLAQKDFAMQKFERLGKNVKNWSNKFGNARWKAHKIIACWCYKEIISHKYSLARCIFYRSSQCSTLPASVAPTMVVTMARCNSPSGARSALAKH